MLPGGPTPGSALFFTFIMMYSRMICWRLAASSLLACGLRGLVRSAPDPLPACKSLSACK